jgi:arylsulfatase A
MKTVFLFSALLLACFQTQAKPNIVLILADDLGYETIGANGGTSYQTPHLDKLAASGMRFEKCYAQPLCTPTRVQLLTGLYNVRNYTSFGSLDRTQTTFAQRLKAAGYATGIFGKWQLGREKDTPQHFGFDESVLWQHTRRPPRYANPGLEFNGVEKDFTNGEYGPDLVNQAALKFIEKYRKQPFLLYYPMILPHAPHQPTPDSADWNPKARGEKRSDKKYFADNVRYIDKLIGNVITTLEKNGLRENTLILFLGDNGTGGGVTSQMGERTVQGGKGQSKVAGMHVPFIANWPGTVVAGKVSKALVDTTDFLPTLCEAAGLKIDDKQPQDGFSLLSHLKGNGDFQRSWIYSWHPQRRREFAADQRFKLYANGELFSYASDPLEKEAVTPETAEDRVARTTLQAALNRFKDARPAALKAQDGRGYQNKTRNQEEEE